MLVRKSDDVALSDFGIAVTGLNTGNLQQQQTEILQKMARGEPIAVPGTAPYLAPERIHGHTQRASDQYSLAVVVYEWLGGRRPFEGSDLEICQKHAHNDPPPLSSINPAITRDIEQVVLKRRAALLVLRTALQSKRPGAIAAAYNALLDDSKNPYSDRQRYYTADRRLSWLRLRSASLFDPHRHNGD